MVGSRVRVCHLREFRRVILLLVLVRYLLYSMEVLVDNVDVPIFEECVRGG